MRYRTGEDSDPQIRDWREVRILNPEFADAIVFLTIALSDESRFSEALIELQELQELEITSQLRSVLDSQGLIGKVYAESKYDLLQNFEQPLSFIYPRFECALKTAMKKTNCVPWYLPQKNATRPCRF